uniref:Uncharacterized protein n=1 Tax=Megaselia scalaris TaxID=36166 RepID=T1GC87_MEGSC
MEARILQILANKFGDTLVKLPRLTRLSQNSAQSFQLLSMLKTISMLMIMQRSIKAKLIRSSEL